MAYYNQQADEEEVDPDAQGQTPIGGESGTITGQGGGAGGAAGAAASASAGNTPAGAAGVGSQFVGIKDYLEANKPQSAKLARDVGGYVGGLGEQARSELDTGVKGFNQTVDQNTIGLNQELLDEAKTDATKVVGDQAKLSEFKKQRDASYKGPNSFDQSDFYKKTNDAVTKANQAATNTQTEQGQKDLISQLQSAKKGKVHQGALAFDSSLLQADPTSKQILAKTKEGMSDIAGKLTSAQEQALAKVGQAKQTTDSTKAAVQGAFTGEQGVQGQLEKQLKDKALGAVNQSKQQADQTMQLLKTGATPNDAQLEILDISRDQWNQLKGDQGYLQSTYGINPYADFSTYGTVKDPTTQINAQNIASAEDYAKYQALNQLMDSQNNFLSDPTQAGKADLDALDFNFGGLKGDITNSISLEKKAADQRAAEAAAAAERERERQKKASLLEQAAYFAMGGPIGGAIGKVMCFMQNTPILMKDGSYKMVQDLLIGDYVAFGGMVMGHGVSLSLNVVEYKGRFTSDQHAIFDGKRFVRAHRIKAATNFNLDKPVLVYPVVTQNHLLISDNGVVYADLIEVDAPGVSDKDKLKLLNKPKYLKFVKCIEKEISWKLLNSDTHTMMH
jgi:hypothetical protein